MKLTLEKGTLVSDRFRIVRFIAEGGMGEVYEARDEVLGEPIALKFLSQRSIDDEHVQRRFRREIQLARKVTHPNVCRLFDVFQHSMRVPGVSAGTFTVTFVTMELLEGETLEDMLEREGPLDEDVALPLVVQMCHALAAAHDAGIVHRDFKTNNVMLVPGDDDRTRVVVTDFGLARSMYPGDPSRTPLTADQLILGTADYMAPEQITGDPVSPRSDIYALGVVLFEMLTGHRPYSAANPMQLLVQRVSQEAAKPRDFRPDISPPWETTILRCLAEDPADRPSSARDIMAELDLTEIMELPHLGISDPSSTYIRVDDLRADLARQGQAGHLPGQWRTAFLIVAAVALLGLITFLASRADRSDTESPTAFLPRRVTTAAGLEIDPALSPDGRSVAYSAEGDDGRFRLFLKSLDATSEPTALAPSLDDSFEPAWSPDGSRIVFHSRADGGLWVVASDGSGAPRRLLDRGARPDWSPDGARIVFQTASSPLLSDTTVPALEGSTLQIIGFADETLGPVSDLTRVGDPGGGHSDPVWTPDGRHVVFGAVRRSEGEIWAVRSDGSSAPRRLVGDGIAAYDPEVARDGRSIYFAARSQEVKALWRLRVDPDTMEPRGVPEELAGVGLSSIRQPAVSGRDDADRALVFSAFLTRSNLWRLPLDPASGLPTGAAEALTQGNDRYNRPAFSADGGRLAYDHWKLGVDLDVFVQDLATGARSQVSRGEGSNSHPSWLADGRVAYTAQHGDEPRVVAVDPTDGSTEVLTVLPVGADWAVVSPDGSKVAFQSDLAGRSLDVWIQELPGGRPYAFTHHGTAAAFPIWSPDGRWLAYQVRKSEGDGTDLWVQSIDGGEAKSLVRDEGHSWPFSFSPDSRRVAYAASRDHAWNLWWVDRLTGETQKITDSKHVTSYLRYPAFSPYGTFVVYEKAETVSDLFVVDGLD